MSPSCPARIPDIPDVAGGGHASGVARYFAATTDGSVHFRVDTQLAAFCKELNRNRCSRSLLHEVHVTVPLQEFKITHPVKIILRAQFHFRVLDDLG